MYMDHTVIVIWCEDYSAQITDNYLYAQLKLILIICLDGVRKGAGGTII